jgi:hypothetical protein
MLSGPFTGMSFKNENNSGYQRLHWYLNSGRWQFNAVRLRTASFHDLIAPALDNSRMAIEQ